MDNPSPAGAAHPRVWAALGPAARTALERDLAPTDVQTLLLAVAKARAAAVTPARLVARWGGDRFVRPASCDPRRLAEVETRLWRLVPERFVGVELSPVVPLGTTSALAPVDQNRVVATVRGTEVLSDPTNALAIEAAARRRADPGPGRIDLATCHRVLRAQRFGPGWASHFRLFALVSSARDRGSGRTEAQLLTDHIGVWQRALAALLPGLDVRVSVTVFAAPLAGRATPSAAVLAERVRDTVEPALAGSPVPVVLDPGRTQGAGYYAGAAIGLRVVDPGSGDVVDLGDGGLTDWTARLLGDAKERCLTSCVATERLAALVSG